MRRGRLKLDTGFFRARSLLGSVTVGCSTGRLAGRLVGVWKNRGSRSRTRAGADREQGRELSTPRHPPAATYRASSGETRAAPTESARDVALSEGAPIIILVEEATQ